MLIVKMHYNIYVSVVFIFFIFYILKKIYQQWVKFSCVQKMSGPPRFNWLFGNMRPLHQTPDKIFTTMRQWGLEYYPIYKLYISHICAANILSPEDMDLILSNMKHIKKSIAYKLLHRWLATGLLTSTGSKWQQRRKILTPAFHFNILQDFILIFNDKTEELVEILKKDVAKGKEYTEVTPLITQFTLKTIGEATMGRKMEFMSKKEINYRQAFHDFIQSLILRMFRPWIFYDFLYMFTPMFFKDLKLIKILHNFTKEIIIEREQNFVPPLEMQRKNKRVAMLDLLLTAKREGGIINDEGIREEVDTFMFEGHDTTAVGITFALMVLANHPEIQERIVEEMRQVLTNLRARPTYRELQDLRYMECCIKEILRLYPSVPYISRELGEDLITHSGYKLKKGTIMQLHIYDLHHNPNVYPDPEKFDPDRFLPENSQNRHPFAFIPFSAGPRNCIGQKFAMLELKTVLCGILGNFKLEPVDTPENIVLVVDIVLRTKDNIKVKFVPRPN